MILWGLSAVAEDWQGADTLTALYTTTGDLSPDAPLHWASTMFVWRVLWPLRWFGLLEVRGPHETFDGAIRWATVPGVTPVSRAARPRRGNETPRAAVGLPPHACFGPGFGCGILALESCPPRTA